MTKNFLNKDSHRDPTFKEMQQQEPARQKLISRWQNFRIIGIYTTAAGFATIGGSWSFLKKFSETSGSIDSVSQMPLIFVIAVAIGSVIILAGGLTFARGQIALNKSFRDFDKAMIIVIANEQNKKKPSTFPTSSSQPERPMKRNALLKKS